MKQYQFITVPPYVGFIVIVPEFKIGVRTKPHWYKRLMMKLLLGWQWEDL